MNEETIEILENELELLYRNSESYKTSIKRLHEDLDKMIEYRNNNQFKINKIKEDLNNE